MTAEHIHPQICELYGFNAMSATTLQFKHNLSSNLLLGKQYEHQPQRFDLTPSDYHLFRYLESFLGGQPFKTLSKKFKPRLCCGFPNRQRHSTRKGYTNSWSLRKLFQQTLNHLEKLTKV